MLDLTLLRFKIVVFVLLVRRLLIAFFTAKLDRTHFTVWNKMSAFAMLIHRLAFQAA